MKTIDLLRFDSSHKLKLVLAEDKFFFDAEVKIYLVMENENILLLDDIFGYAFKEVYRCFVSEQIADLCEPFLDFDIGLAANEYYLFCSESDETEKTCAIAESNLIKEDERGMWIGDEFNLFDSRGYSTWIYRKEGVIWIKITKLYPWFFIEPAEYSYEDFLQNYSIIYEGNIDEEQLEKCKILLNGIKPLIIV